MTKTIPEAIRAIEVSGYECEAGPLVNCTDWQLLRDTILEQDSRIKSRFNIGDRVWYQISTTLHGVVLSSWIDVVVTAIRAQSTDSGFDFIYTICRQMPDAYYEPDVISNNVSHTYLKTEKPE